MVIIPQTAVRAGSLLVGHAQVLARSIIILATLNLCLAWGQGWTCGGGVCWTTGNVGIGTATPTAKLEVKDGNATVVQLDGTTANNNFVIGNVDDGTNFYTYMAQGSAVNSPLTFYGPTNGSLYGIEVRNSGGNWNGVKIYNNDAYGGIQSTNSLVLQPTSGNVGIGTTAPQHMLQVSGVIGAEEVIVSSTGADYVFGTDYRLSPLSEVAAYIKEHHHLPEIPSEAEVSKSGASLGEMQTKLLAKIEELTLHMIQADDRNTRLEQENHELRERVARLESGR